MEFKTLSIVYEESLAFVRLNRPDKANAINNAMFQEIKEAFESINNNREIRAVILTGNGKHFCSGIDLSVLQEILTKGSECEGRLREGLLNELYHFQHCITAVENCRKPVIAAIHGACIGAGLDLVCACDIRYCASETSFSIKEVDMGMVADLGTLQRLPKIINSSFVREMALTGKIVNGFEAKEYGIVSKVFEDEEALIKEAKMVGQMIASKSPLAIRGIKENLNYSRDKSVEEGLKYVAAWNAGMLLSNDIKEIFQALKDGQKPQFKD